jgi:hypothetical protein
MEVRSAGDFIRRDGEGNLLFDSRQAGPGENAPGVTWIPPLPPHSVENIGKSEILLFTVELKRATA